MAPLDCSRISYAHGSSSMPVVNNLAGVRHTTQSTRRAPCSTDPGRPRGAWAPGSPARSSCRNAGRRAATEGDSWPKYIIV